MQYTIGVNRSYFKVISPYYCIVRNNNYLEEMVQQNWDWSDTITFYLGPQNKMFAGMTEAVVTACGGKINTSRFVFIDIADRYTGLDLLNKGHKVANAGEFAIYVAIWLGFSYIYLLGYDCAGMEGHFKTGATTGRWKEDKVTDHATMAAWFNKTWGPNIAEACKAAKRQVNIWNCNPNSWIKYWPMKTLDEALDDAVKVSTNQPSGNV
jgi:hypothetical protein